VPFVGFAGVRSAIPAVALVTHASAMPMHNISRFIDLPQ
jgi:hypothetical protein